MQISLPEGVTGVEVDGGRKLLVEMDPEVSKCVTVVQNEGGACQSVQLPKTKMEVASELATW